MDVTSLNRWNDRPVRKEHIQLVPIDKGFPQVYYEGLRERGTKQVYVSGTSQFIGMPVSGICTGQVYLSGDGRLCYWDVFKSYGGRDDTGNPWGPHYAEPLIPQPEFEQGFAIRIAGDPLVRRLDGSGFAEVEFCGEYPIATVSYRDPKSPLAIELEAFSPFIPLNADDSGLPATILNYHITNHSDLDIDVEIGGWMDNRVCHFEPPLQGARANQVIVQERSLSVLFETVDVPAPEPEGFGNMVLGLLNPMAGDHAISSLNVAQRDPEQVLFSTEKNHNSARGSFDAVNVGALVAKRKVRAGETVIVSFAVTWYFPKYSGGKVFLWSLDHLENLESKRRYYGTRFVDAGDVLNYVAENFEHLTGTTRLWRDCWYDSSLPLWFLDRTFANTSILATQTVHRFEDGRFYGWEGVDSCPGTCQHVWQYAQAVANVFPELERDLRERVDFGLAWHPDGSIDYRGEASRPENGAPPPLENPGLGIVAADGLAGTIIRAYREHKHSADNGFLIRIWPRIKKSIEFMMSMDSDADGLLEGPQYNTLDATWFGRISWISSLFLGALACGKAMATDLGEAKFAQICDVRLQAGRENIVTKLFNGRYFEHEADRQRPWSMDMGDGCYIDQVLGQSFAHQIGFERVVPLEASRAALQSIWDFSFAPDVGPYREQFREIEGGRWYAMPGEAGLLMCSWPLSAPNRDGKIQEELTDDEMGVGITSEGYLNECMTGFEYQVAAHMIAEGLVDEGLAIIKAIDDRYNGNKRNPYNEVECGDHYSRAMASYGAYRTICGFDYHGPRGEIRFNPRIGQNAFRCAFIGSEGWGTFTSVQLQFRTEVSIVLRFGVLRLSTIILESRQPHSVHVRVLRGLDEIDCASSMDFEGNICIQLDKEIELNIEQSSELKIVLFDSAEYQSVA